MARNQQQNGAQTLLFPVAPEEREAPTAKPLPSPTPMPADAAARRSALDTSRSVLVQAPAGAGKTSLLTQRYLALLAEVDEPEQILAITFTRAATAEMRTRIMEALEGARETPAAQPGEPPELPLARAALRHAQALDWRLLEQPHRLDVQTIDSLCLRFAHGQPLLARLGGALAPTEDAAGMYAAAARRTTAQLARPDSGERKGELNSELSDSLCTLLLRRDNNLDEVERLLAAMLSRRDAWLGVLPLGPTDQVDWSAVRAELEWPFADENRRVLRELRATMEAVPELTRDLLEVGRYAAQNLSEAPEKLDLSLLRTLEQLPGDTHAHRDHWLALASLLLTQSDCWRKKWTASDGFPPPGTDPGSKERGRLKALMKHCCEDLQVHPAAGERLLDLLCQLRTLPAPHYSEDQWHTLLAVFRVLRRAAAELRLVFAENNAVDFIEIAQAAEAVLRDPGSMRGLIESERKQHLLIDEFQDTSRAQYRLIAELLREWAPGDGRTLFLVGDPLQSIYAFRQAEVTLFHETREHGLRCGDDGRHPCHMLQLTHNFRSHLGLVSALNGRLGAIFAPAQAQALHASAGDSVEDSFVPAEAWPLPGSDEAGFQIHPLFVDRDAGESADQACQLEAATVVDLLRAELPRIAAATAGGQREYRVAVLVSSRTHLDAIAPALRAASIPFRAIELEPLAEQPEVHDLHMLLRALLHPADRVAWLSVLRAPWCGLLLKDLHALAGADDPKLLRGSILERIGDALAAPDATLSPDGHARLKRTWTVLKEALRARHSGANNLSLARWLERTWEALGGPACVQGASRENDEAFFRLLDTLDPSGVDVLRGDFGQRLLRLCAAPDTRVDEHFGVQLMTMHKAKGLGFEVVLLPGLDRLPRSDETELVAMLQRSRPGLPGSAVETELLLAPVTDRDEEERDRTYAWVAARKCAREAAERKRLFYVACTRARTRLHLLARIEVSKGELRKPDGRSLLGAAWPGLREELETRWRERAAPAGARAFSGTGLTLAAVADVAAAEPKTENTLLRLPSDWRPEAALGTLGARATPGRPLFARKEGSLAARTRGNALHALLERLTALLAASPRSGEHTGAETPAQWRSILEQTATAVLREGAFPPEKSQATASSLAEQALAVAASDTGRWLLSPHPGARAESAWQSWDTDGNLRTLRVDRTFLAGEAPGQLGESHRWVIDYKTGAPSQPLATVRERTEWLALQRQQWQPQLEAYGLVITAADPEPKPLRYALFFPELLELVWWA